MAKPKLGELIASCRFRMSYPALVEPSGFQDDEKLSYSVEGVFYPAKQTDEDKAALDRMIEGADAVIEAERWRGVKTLRNLVDTSKGRSPFAASDDEPDELWYAPVRPSLREKFGGGVVHVKFRCPETRGQPRIYEADMSELNDDVDLLKEAIYGGRWARASISPFCWTFGGKRGVSYGLRGIQLLDHAPRFGRNSDDEDPGAVFSATTINRPEEEAFFDDVAQANAPAPPDEDDDDVPF